MPSAEPAQPPGDDNDDAAGVPGGARIIPLNPRTAARRTAPPPGAAADMTPTPRTPGQPDDNNDRNDDGDGGEGTLLRPIADTLELRLQARHQTLADPRTLDAVQAALEVAQAVMDGAHAQGTVDAAQSAALATLLDGVARAARLAHEEG